MRTLITFGLAAIGMIATCFPAAVPPTSSTGRPVDVFASLDGAWEGTFIGYDERGKELYRISVRQRYRTLTDTTQTVEIRDTMPDGTVITGIGENTATRRADGSLDLRCTVRKSNGDRVSHTGRLVTGPDGDKQIIWHSDGVNRTETFREHVHRDQHGRNVYEINGMGQYGQSLILMHGRYYRPLGGLPDVPKP